MLTVEELKKFTKLITQDAWKQEMNTTLNDMVEYICFRVGEKLLEEFTKEFDEYEKHAQELTSDINNILNKLDEIDLRTRKLEDASKDGGVQKPQRSKKTGA